LHPRRISPRATNMRWLMSLAHMEPAPVSRAAAVRAALAIGLPSAAGLALDQSAAAALVALGALPSITGDNGGPYRNRAVSIGCTVLGGMLGYVLGALLYGQGWAGGVAMIALVLAASLIGTLNNIAAVATLQFATYVIVGSSLPTALPPWMPALLVGAGGLFGLALTLAGWIVHPTAPERAAVALAYRKLAAMYAAIGTSRTMMARRDMETAMASAYDAVLAARRRAAGPSPRLSRLAAQLQACTPLSNAALALARAGRVLPAECARAMNRIADRIENGAPPAPQAEIAALRAAGMPQLADALAHIGPQLAGEASAPAAAAEASMPAPAPRTSWRALLRIYRPGPVAARYLGRLALCLVAAEAVALTGLLPRSYWVPLVVVVVFKPNFGSVFARALQSCAGSVAGVAISATVMALDRSGVVSLAALTALAALLPWSIRRNYGLFSAILLPILMLLIGALQPGSWPIALARFIDVLAAASIVIVVGYLPWMRLERHNLDHAVAAAMQTLAAYLNASYQDRAASRLALRAQTYARLSDLRIALQRALSEPRPVSRRALAWWPVEVELERVANTLSDTLPPAPDAAPAPSDVARLAGALQEMAQAVEQGRPVPAGPAPVSAAALREAAARIEAVRAALAGPEFAAAPAAAPS